MSWTNVGIGFIRDPLEWAAACEAQLGLETEPEARDALKQLAEEFKLPPARFVGWSALRKLCSSAKQVADPDYGVATLERGLGGTGGRRGARRYQGNLSPESVGKSEDDPVKAPIGADQGNTGTGIRRDVTVAEVAEVLSVDPGWFPDVA